MPFFPTLGADHLAIVVHSSMVLTTQTTLPNNGSCFRRCSLTITPTLRPLINVVIEVTVGVTIVVVQGPLKVVDAVQNQLVFQCTS